MAYEHPAYDHQPILDDLRYWPLMEDEAHKKFIFNLNLIPGCKITRDHQELMALVVISINVIDLKEYPAARQAYARALSHIGVQLGQYGQPPELIATSI